jgi:serine/threonine protein kinase
MEMLSTIKGTISYMAPELFGYEPGSSYQVDYQAADMWSLGEMAFRMLTKTATFPSHGSLFRYLARPDLFPSQELARQNSSEQAISFLQSLMRPAPEDRIRSVQALDHVWVQPCKVSGPTLTPPALSLPQ